MQSRETGVRSRRIPLQYCPIPYNTVQQVNLAVTHLAADLERCICRGEQVFIFIFFIYLLQTLHLPSVKRPNKNVCFVYYVFTLFVVLGFRV